METVRKLETMMAGWYKDMPHLPQNGRKWLAENIWWLALIGVILGAMGVLALLSATLLAGALLAGFGGPVGAALGGVAVFIVLAMLLLSIVSLVIAGLAIAPLKAKQKKGWMLLFILVLLGAAAAVVEFLLGFNVFALVWGLLVAAVGAYFLFEIRDLFGTGRKVVKAKKTV